jgi:hypothetical protein
MYVEGSTQAGGFLDLGPCSLAAAGFAVRRFDAGFVRCPWPFTPDRSRAGNAVRSCSEHICSRWHWQSASRSGSEPTGLTAAPAARRKDRKQGQR